MKGKTNVPGPSVWTLLGIGIAEVAISTTTGSLTLYADGLDSMADALISFIVWFGISMIQKPKTKLSLWIWKD